MDNSDFFEVKLKNNNFRKQMNKYREEKKFIDVHLKVGNKLFDAHRNVLSLYSPVLRAAISDRWSITKICRISDEYVDPEMVDDLLSFLYTGSIKLTADNIHPVCVAAHFLQISALLEHSVIYLCRLVTVENVLPLFQFSNNCQLNLLHKRCLFVLISSYEKVFQSPQLLDFSFDDFKVLIIGLKENFLGTTLREHTFDCIVRWTEKNLLERSNHLPILLKNIPPKELPFKFMTETVSVHPLVKDSFSCQQVLSALSANNQTSKNFELSKKKTMILISPPSMSCYNSNRRTWRNLPGLHSLRFVYSTAVVNQQDIIVYGGQVYPNRGEATDSLMMFNWIEQAWTKLPAMPVLLEGLSMTAHKNHLYVVGRKKQIEPLTALCYSLETKQWKGITSCKESRNIAFGHLVSSNSYLYVVGGNCFKIVRYDPERDEWTKMAQFSGFRINSVYKAVFHQDKIYIFSQKRFEVFDPATKELTVLPEPDTTLKFNGLVSMNDRLLTVASREQNRHYSVFEFSIGYERWIQNENIAQRHNLHSALLTVGHFF